MHKRALITGICGQDGAYLAELLLGQGYEVWGGVGGSGSRHRLQELGIAEHVRLLHLDVCERQDAIAALERVRPDELYNLAARSGVAASFELPVHTARANALGALHLLEAVRAVDPEVKFFQASSSEMFGGADGLLHEQSPMRPRSPYGFSKLFAHWATVNYREARGLRACSGILFNHESPLRDGRFVSRKISVAAAAAALGDDGRPLQLGCLDARRDWGHARDFAYGMWRMLQQQDLRDYVLATGQAHSVRELAQEAFGVAGLHLRWEGEGANERGLDREGNVRVSVDPALYRPAEVGCTVGDASLARAELGWSPGTGFRELVAEMVGRDLGRSP